MELERSALKNTKHGFTIDALGAIFAILDTFTTTFSRLLLYYYNTKLLQYFCNTLTIVDTVGNVDIVGNADIVGNVDIVGTVAILTLLAMWQCW